MECTWVRSIWDRKRARHAFRASALRFSDYYRILAQSNTENPLRLAADMGNIFAAISLFGEAKAWKGVVEIVQAIHPYLEAEGHWEDLIAVFNVAIESAEHYFWSRGRSPEPKAWHDRITLRTKLSTLHFRRGQYEIAQQLAEEALQLSRRIQHRKLEALIQGMLGTIVMARGDPAAGWRLHSESRANFEALGELGGLALTRDQEITLTRSQGDIERAWQLATQRLDLVRETGETVKIADVASELGDLALARQDYARARALYEESLQLFRQLNQPSGIAQVLNREAGLAQTLGDLDTAHKLLDQQIKMEREYGDSASVLDAVLDGASLATDRSAPEEAERLFQEALQIATRLGNLSARAISLQGLGHLWQERRDFELAHAFFEDGLAAATASGHPKLIGAVLSRLALLARVREQYDRARSYLLERLSIERRLASDPAIAKTLLELGDVASLSSDSAEARRYYLQSQQLCQQLDDNNGQALCLACLSALALESGEYPQAWEMASHAFDMGYREGDTYTRWVTLNRITAFLELPDYRARASKLVAQSFAADNPPGIEPAG